MHEQVRELTGVDDEAVEALRRIIVEEQEHHDVSEARLGPPGFWPKIINPLVGASTHVVIWLGMRLRSG
jgi:ubiquinone biosynthesis monooxygenase Coq7